MWLNCLFFFWRGPLVTVKSPGKRLAWDDIICSFLIPLLILKDQLVQANRGVFCSKMKSFLTYLKLFYPGNLSNFDLVITQMKFMRHFPFDSHILKPTQTVSDTKKTQLDILMWLETKTKTTLHQHVGSKKNHKHRFSRSVVWTDATKLPCCCQWRFAWRQTAWRGLGEILLHRRLSVLEWPSLGE